jgi:hypothetical protein
MLNVRSKQRNEVWNFSQLTSVMHFRNTNLMLCRIIKYLVQESISHTVYDGLPTIHQFAIK